MNWFRQTIEQHRKTFLTLLAINIFFMVDGTSYVYAHELKQKEQEQFLRSLSRTLGVPLGQLQPERTPKHEHFEKVYEDRMAPWAVSGSRWIEGVYEELVEQFEEATFLPERGRLHVASPQDLSGSGSSRPNDETPRAELPSLAIEVGGKEQAKAASFARDGDLPLRRLEQKAQTERGTASSLKAAGMPARAPASAPRGLIPKSGVAPEIVALAESLGNSPGRIFRYVHDQIDFDPKWGAGKTALGTLHEGSGTSWEQAWLLQELLTAAGVDARFEWGEVQISTELLLGIAGVADPFRAGDLLTTAGMPIVLVVEGSQVVHARMSHAWVKAHLDYIPNRGATPGPGDTWIRMDPSLKRFEVTEGVRLDEAVPYVLGDYLESGTEESPLQAYETALQTHIDAQNLGVTLEQIQPAHSIVEEAFPFVPGTLRGKILNVDGESATLPESHQQQLALEVREAGGAVLLNWTLPWPSAYGRRLEVAWPGATSADEATLDLYGGVFQTPPYEVDLKPVLRLDGVDLVTGSAIGSAEDAVLRATLTPPGGPATVVAFELRAGERAIFAVDFGRTPQQTIDSHAAALAAATEAEELEAWGLALAAAAYTRSLAGDIERLSLLRGLRRVQLGNAVLAVQRGGVSTAPDGTPLTFAIAPPAVDLGSMTLGLFPADSVPASPEASVSTLELLGSHGSFLEGEALAAALGGTHLTAVTALTRAVREGQPLTRVDAANVDTALAAADLGDDAEASIRAGVDGGKIAWIHQNQLLHETWDAAGYVLEDPATGAGGYFVTYERLLTGLDADITFHSPQDLAVITEPTDVIATIDSEHEITSWTLSYQAADGGEAVVLASGSGTVASETLAEFDPTLLLNGLYDLVLTARDALGQGASVKSSVVVEGQMKIGHFSLSFVDLAIPISGLDLEIIRTYDSRARWLDDFGMGWNLDVRQGSYVNNRLPGEGWQLAEGFLPCDSALESKSHLTAIRLSDREIYRFALNLVNGVPSTGGGCFATAVFEYLDGPVPGATLEILGNDQVFQETPSIDRVIDVDTLATFEPRQVRLRTRDGRTFDFDLDQGVTRLEDTHGNELEITEDGITHSVGLEISFLRDAQGRITQITDTAGEEMVYTYDIAGDLVRFEDRAGSVMTYQYEGDHYLTAIRTGEGKTLLTADFGTDGRVTQQCDGDLNCTQLVHNLDQSEQRRIDPTQRETIYRYDNRGNMTLVVDGLGNESRFEYDEKDRMTRAIDPLGAVTEWVYENGNPTRIIAPYPEGSDSDDYTTQMSYDGSGNLTELLLADGSKWSVTYDQNSNPIEVRDGSQRVLLTTTYDGQGNVTSETTRFGTMTFEQLTTYGEPRREIGPSGELTEVTYGNLGEVTSLTAGALTATFEHDAIGRETRAEYNDGLWHETAYDELGRWAGDSSPLSGSVTRRLDGAARLAAWELPGGVERTYERDASGRLLAEVDPLGRRLENSYDSAGRLVAVTDSAGATTDLELDAVGRAVRIINALDQASELEYWPDGRVRLQRDPLGNETTFVSGPGWSETTDALSRTVRSETGSEGELTRFVYPDGTEARWTYVEDAPQGEKEDYVTAFIDELGESWTRSYDAVGRLENVADPTLATWTYAYSGADLTSVTLPDGELLFDNTWDDFGRPTSLTYAGGATETYGYGLGPDPTSIVHPSGTTATLTYDPSGRLVSRSTDSGDSETYQWNAVGDLVEAVGGSGTTSYSYDTAGRFSGLARSDGAEVAYTHDLVGRVTEVTVLGAGETLGHTTSYGYDAAGRVTSLADPSGESTSWSYDAIGRATSKTLPNGVVTEFAYDLRDRLTSVVHKRPDGSLLASFTYERDPRGAPTRIVREDGSAREYDYDAAFRLVAERELNASGQLVTERAWEFDANGNRIARIVDGNRADHQLGPGLRLLGVSEGGTPIESYGWDTTGRVTSIERGGSNWALGYDSEDQLTSVDLDGNSVSYSYDAEGRRVGIQSGGVGRDLVVAPAAHGDVDRIHLISDGTESVVYSWLGLTPHSRQTSSGTVYYLTDGLGNVIGQVDETGDLVASFDYGPFGSIRNQTGDTAPPAVAGGDFRFQGGWQDATTRLIQFGVREYDPSTGRFLTRDPAAPDLQDPTTLHSYVFADSNPLVFSDPTGLFSFPEINVTLNTQSIVSSIRAGVKLALKQRLKDELGQAVTNVVLQFLDRTLGMGLQEFIFAKIGFRNLKPWELGRHFELSVRDAVCSRLPGVSANWLWFEPGVNLLDGKPATDGLSCERRYENVGRKKDTRYPDLIIKRIAPRRNAEKTMITAEFKLGTGTFYRAWIKPGKRRDQFRAIARHARNYGYPPNVVFLLSLKGGKKLWRKQLQRNLRAAGVRGWVRTLF